MLFPFYIKINGLANGVQNSFIVYQIDSDKLIFNIFFIK
jgi:hypothetical protein